MTKKKEIELKRMALRFQAVMDTFPFDMWYKDLDGKYILVNKSFEEYTGKPKAEIIGKKDQEIYPPEEAEKYVSTDAETIQGRTFGYYEVDMPNGKYKEEFKKPCFDEKGRLLGTTGFNRDITDRKKIYNALIESEESKARLLSNLPGVAYRCDNDDAWTMLFLSEGCFGLTGYKPEELMSVGGKTYYDLINPDYLAPLQKKWREDINANRVSTDEYPIKTASGQIKWVWEQSRGVHDENGKLIASEGFITDITDRMLSEEALRKSEERFRTIFEKSQIGIGIYNAGTGRAIQANDRLAEILGRTKEELMRLKWQEYNYYEDFEDTSIKMTLLNQGKIDSFHIEKQFVKPDGTIIWVNMIVTPFDSEETSELCHLCMFNDISAQKQAEQETIYLSFHDQLTGLYNRRYYDEELKRLDVERNLPISLVMADVNGLKLTNDAFGHLSGDQLLKKIGQIMMKECRADEIVARIGGDEFIMLLPRTSEIAANLVIKRINAAVQKEKWENIPCSVSFGLGTKTKTYEDMKKIYMQAEDRMYRDKLAESRSMRYETIRIIRETLYQKNKREQRHCERVGELCEAIGKALGFSAGEVLELKTAGLLHDIGKIGIDENILDKAGSLTSQEWEEMERHPEIGYHILSAVNEFATIAEYVLSHHERVDGKGYPRKLQLKEIPLQAKIIALADSYDAMTDERTYKKVLTKEEAIEEILKNVGTQFDADLAEVFIESVLKTN